MAVCRINEVTGLTGFSQKKNVQHFGGTKKLTRRDKEVTELMR